jgi:hypothetical protein
MSRGRHRYCQQRLIEVLFNIALVGEVLLLKKGRLIITTAFYSLLLILYYNYYGCVTVF